MGLPFFFPSAPKLGNHTHRTHFNLYAAHLQGSIRAFGGKFVGSLSLRWQDFERHWDVKKKGCWWLMCFFWKIIIMTPIYKEKTYYIVIYIYIYMDLHYGNHWHWIIPRKFNVNLILYFDAEKNLENKNPWSLLFEGAFLGGIDVFGRFDDAVWIPWYFVGICFGHPDFQKVPWSHCFLPMAEKKLASSPESVLQKKLDRTKSRSMWKNSSSKNKLT